MSNARGATLGWQAETTLFLAALVLVTIVYVPAFLLVGQWRSEELAVILAKDEGGLPGRARLVTAFRDALINEVRNMPRSAAPLVFGHITLPAPSVSESEFRRYRKAVQDRDKFWTANRELLTDGKNDSVDRLMDDLDPSVASKFFGWEQWLSYVLAAWSVLLLWNQWRAVVKAEKAWAVPGALPPHDEREAFAETVDGNLGMLRFSIWAIPTIGFIGTVRGMGSALAAASSPQNTPLIVGHLGIAFDTTLVGLLLSLLLVFTKHRFDTVLDRLAAR